MNGGSVCRVFGCDLRSTTSSPASARSRSTLFATSRLRISGFLPSKRARRATNDAESPGFFASTPRRKYVSGLNASISRWRSTSRRSATDCTRPADSERLLGQFTFFQSIGETL